MTKPWLILSTILFSVSLSPAQKTLDFANAAPGMNAPVTNSSGQRITAPGSFVADLFYSTNANAVPNPLGSDSFLAAGFNQGFSSAAAGYFFGGTKSIANATNIVVQVRVWDTTYGSTYTAARNAGGQFGYSGYFVIVLASLPSTPTLLTSLNGFKLTTVHSPTQGADDYGGADSPPVVVVGGRETSAETYSLLSPQSYGCGPWLEVTKTNNSSVLLTLHNSIAGRAYQLSSKQSLSLTNWTLETNFVGVSGQTQIRIGMGSRTNLFLTGDPDPSFRGLGADNAYAANPDTMGVIGANYFVELLNGGIGVFARTNGQLLQIADLYGFFVVSNTPPPTITDTRILYDRDNGHWIASSINNNQNSNTYDLMLAVSKDSSPIDIITNWNRYTIKTTQAGSYTDFDTMGMDSNGIYISVVHGSLTAPMTNTGFTVVAIRKQDIYTGKTNYVVLTNTNPGLLSWAIQPAVNFDPVATNGYAWFVAKGPPTLGSGYKGGAVLYRRLQWSGTNAYWVEPNWVSAPSTNYQNYYDFDGTNSVYTPAAGIGAPQAGGSTKISLGYVGSRLMTAVIRNGYLWTCQHVGLSGTNGSYSGDQTGSTVDRSAAQWIRFQVGTTNLLYNDSERIFDPVSTNAFWYYFPSLAINCNNDMAMAYSGSSGLNYIGAYYSWLFSGYSISTKPFLMQSGNVYYNNYRWGDYSCTSVDPTDDWGVWTVQEYATNALPSFPWSTWIMQINRDP